MNYELKKVLLQKISIKLPLKIEKDLYQTIVNIQYSLYLV